MALCPLRNDTGVGLLQPSAAPQAPFTPSFCFPHACFLVLVLLGLDTVEMELNYLTENTALCPDFLFHSHTHTQRHAWCWYIQCEKCWVRVCFKSQSGGRRSGAMRGKIRGPQGLVWPCTLSIKCCLPMPWSALMRVCSDPCTKCHHPHTHTLNTAYTGATLLHLEVSVWDRRMLFSRHHTWQSSIKCQWKGNAQLSSASARTTPNVGIIVVWKASSSIYLKSAWYGCLFSFHVEKWLVKSFLLYKKNH